MSLTKLMEKAKEAKPKKGSRSSWKRFFPIIAKLHERGFTTWTAVGWLIDEGEVSEDDRRRCYHAALDYFSEDDDQS